MVIEAYGFKINIPIIYNRQIEEQINYFYVLYKMNGYTVVVDEKFNLSYYNDCKINNIKTDDIIKQLLFDYNFTINTYNNEIFGSDETYIKKCNELTFKIIKQIKK